MKCRRTRLGAVVCLLFGALVMVGTDARPTRAAEAVSSAAFTPISPQRLVDTRVGLGAPAQRLQAGSTMDIQVSGRLGIPEGATAVVANVTAVDASGPGYLQVLPTGQAALGSASTLNIDAGGQTIPNAAFAPLGNGGRLTIYAIFTTDVVIDVSGYFTPAIAASAGRLVPLTPDRILDTRISLGYQSSFTAGHREAVAAGTVITLDVAGRGGVPEAGASAVVMNVTAVDPAGAGYVQVAPTPITAGASSNLNTAAGRTIANLVVVPIGDQGSVDLYVTTPADLVADVVGYFTDPTAANSSVGLFVPITPSRQLDTRDGSTRAVSGGSVTRIDANDVSPTAIAIAGNLTATEASRPGYLQLAAAPVAVGASSSLNIAYVGQTIANAVVSPLAAGQLDLYNQYATHELLDVTGWFTSRPAAFPTAALYQMNEPAGADVLVDSSGNGLHGLIGGDVEEATNIDGAIVHRFPYLAPNTPPARPGHLDLVPHHAKLNPGTADFAVAMRVKWTHSFGNIIQKGQSGTAGGYFKWEAPNGMLRCMFRDAGDVTLVATSTSPLNDGQWHTIRCERTAEAVMMTVDGVVDHWAPGTVGSIANTWPLSIAGKSSCDQIEVTCDYFVGDIDWIRIEKG